MTENIVKDFETFVHIHGPAQVAVWLNYRDSRAISTWLKRREIPKARRAQVQELLRGRMVV